MLFRLISLVKLLIVTLFHEKPPPLSHRIAAFPKVNERGTPFSVYAFLLDQEGEALLACRPSCTGRGYFGQFSLAVFETLKNLFHYTRNLSGYSLLAQYLSHGIPAKDLNPFAHMSFCTAIHQGRGDSLVASQGHPAFQP